VRFVNLAGFELLLLPLFVALAHLQPTPMLCLC